MTYALYLTEPIWTHITVEASGIVERTRGSKGCLRLGWYPYPLARLIPEKVSKGKLNSIAAFCASRCRHDYVITKS